MGEHTNTLINIVITLIAFILTVGIVAAADTQGHAGGVMAWIDEWIERFFDMTTEEDSIAIDSTVALSCAVDTTNLWGRGDAPPNGEAIFTSASCSDGILISADTAEEESDVTGMVIGAFSRITGKLLDYEDWSEEDEGPINKCGYYGNQEVCSIGGDICEEGERCKSTGVPKVGICVKDETCISPVTRTKELVNEGFEAVCFSTEKHPNHVCVACGVDKANAIITHEVKCCKCERTIPGTYEYIKIEGGTTAESCIQYAGKIYNDPEDGPIQLYACEDDPTNTCLNEESAIEEMIESEIENQPNGFYCKVIGFELPQDVIDGNPILGPINYLAVTGDPKYLVYNEKFPERVTENWNINGVDMAVIAVSSAVGSSLLFDCALPGLGKVLKNSKTLANVGMEKYVAQSEAAIDSGKKVIGDIADETLGVIFTRRGISKAVKSSIMKETEEGLQRTVDLATHRLAFNSFKNGIKSKDGVLLSDTAKEDVAEKIVDYFRIMDDETVNDVYKKAAKDQVDLVFSKNKITIGGKEFQTADDLFDGTMDANVKTALQEASTARANIYSINNYVLPQIQTLIEKEEIVFTYINEKGLKTRLEKSSDIYFNKDVLDLSVDAIIKSETEGDAVAKSFVAFGEASFPKIFGATEKSEARAKALVFTRHMKGLGFSQSSIDLRTTKGKLTVLMFAAGVIAERADDRNNLLSAANCGTNNMCLFGNSWPDSSNAEVMQQEKLNDVTKTTLIELEGSDNDGAFYLASPCMADLKIVPDMCDCKEYYGTDKVYANFVIQQWTNDPHGTCYISPELMIPYECQVNEVVDEFNVEITFPYDYKGLEFPFTYIPETENGGESQGYEVKLVQGNKNSDYKKGTIGVIDKDNIIMLEQAFNQMNKVNRSRWVIANYGQTFNPITEFTEFKLITPDYANIEDGTEYKKCIKGDWWAFWRADEEVPCIKIEAEDYPSVEPNFCFEKDWDSADTYTWGLTGAEIAFGVAAAAIATPESLGAAAIPAYCAASTAVSAAGAWWLSGEVADDKWPNGIGQD